MPKRALRKFLPTPTRLRRVKGLGAFTDIFDRQELWHISRSSIARATGIGLFCAMVPLPGQMLVAVFVAIRLGANVPLAFSLIFVTNPLTMPVVYLAAYLMGSWLLGMPVIDVSSINWLDVTSPELLKIWPPFLLGCLVLGALAAFFGYFIADGLWRMRLAQRISERAERRKDRRRLLRETRNQARTDRLKSKR